MKLSKQQETEVMDVYNAYWDHYLKGNVEAMIPLLDDDYTQVGSAETEVFFNKKDAVQFLVDTIAQVAGKLEMRNRSTKLEQQDSILLLHELCDVYVLTGKEWNFYSKFRASTLMLKKNKEWKIIHQHSSMPDIRTQEGENIAIEKISRENLELRDAIKRRTIELEQKNHELEIEGSLERVRARALSMKKPDDLPGICEILFEELRKLGFSEIRNAMINIHNDANSSFLNYDYSDTIGKSITHLFYNTHPLVEKQIKQIRSSSDAFSETSFRGKELDEWIAFRKKKGEKDDPRLENISALFYYFYSIGTGSIGISTFGAIISQKLKVLKQFRNVFDFAYSRYIELTRAEAQAYEARIEASLERIRAQAMSMRKPDELATIGKTIFTELKSLCFNDLRNTEIILNNDQKESVFSYYCDYGVTGTVEVFYKTNPIVQQWVEDLKKASNAFAAVEIPEKEMDVWRTFRESIGYLPDPKLDAAKTVYYYSYSIGVGALSISSFTAITDDQLKTLERFRNVFDLAYRRFADVTQAEAQAREAKIEAALEKVRGRAMAMHNSNDLSATASIVFSELRKLGIHPIRSGVGLLTQDAYQVLLYAATSSSESDALALVGPIDMSANPYLKMQYESCLKKENYFPVLSGEELKAYYKELADQISVPSLTGEQFRHEQYGYYFPFSEGYFYAWTENAYSEDEINILNRFKSIIDLTFRRYLDLQKAEAQAREALIEAALERVRSRTMGMQKSEELKEVIQVVYQQFVHINILIEHTGFIMDYKARDDMHIWLADRHDVPFQVTIPYFNCAHWNSFNEAKEKVLDFFPNHLSFQEKNKFYEDLFKLIPGVPKETMDYYFSCPGLAISTVLLENVGLYIENFLGIPYTDEENNILMRFGKVFQQTYTRFLDLQKAEAQAREAQIELALERVRARTMAMQKSEELGDVATVLFKELNQLVENLWTCGFVLCQKDRGEDEWWLSTGDGFIPAFYLPNTVDPTHTNIYDAWKKGETYHTEQLEGKALKEHYDWLMNIPVTKNIFDEMKAAGNSLPTWQKLHCAYFSYGYLVMITQVPCLEEQIFKRFAQVFDQTYTRFLDLQKAEAQAREAQIEAALERVRSRTMAMHKSDELAETATVLFQQLIQLGIEPNRLYITLIHDGVHQAECWMTGEDGSKVSFAFFTDLNATPTFLKMFEGWQQQKKSIVLDMNGQELQEYFQYLSKLNVPFINGLLQTRRVQHIAYFAKGFIGMASPEPQPIGTINLLERFAAVFNLTYTRFNDLQIAEANAKNAQVEEQKLREEKKRSDSLLLNILPEEIANELKEFGKSYARKHEEVTILFADIKGFSTIAENLSANDLVSQLDECFRAFDNIVEKHGLEKIKTVGDAYVCACGLPKPVQDNAIKTVKAALDMIDFLKGFNTSKKIQNLPAFEFRVGIHTGPVITGVVGLKKFTYDVWGDAVNMAARMEQHSEAGKINVSGNTYRFIKAKFNCIHRGKIAAKNKGEVDMYFVDHPI